MFTEYEEALKDCPQGPDYRGRWSYGRFDSIKDQFFKKYDRYKIVETYGFAIPSINALNKIIDFVKSKAIIEVGGGTGYWSYELKKLGQDIICTDPIIDAENYNFKKTWVEIERLTAEEAINKYPDRITMLCWPTYDAPWAGQFLQKYQGNQLIYIGEYGDCCGDSTMVDELDKYVNQTIINIPVWHGIHDALYLLSKEELKCP